MCLRPLAPIRLAAGGSASSPATAAAKGSSTKGAMDPLAAIRSAWLGMGVPTTGTSRARDSTAFVGELAKYRAVVGMGETVTDAPGNAGPPTAEPDRGQLLSEPLHLPLRRSPRKVGPEGEHHDPVRGHALPDQPPPHLFARGEARSARRRSHPRTRSPAPAVTPRAVGSDQAFLRPRHQRLQDREGVLVDEPRAGPPAKGQAPGPQRRAGGGPRAGAPPPPPGPPGPGSGRPGPSARAGHGDPPPVRPRTGRWNFQEHAETASDARKNLRAPGP